MDTCKPIAVIYFPPDFTFGPYGGTINPQKLTREMNGWGDTGKQYDALNDYLWFCFFKPGIQSPEFNVFNPKDFTDIQYQELKDLVMDELNKTNPVYPSDAYMEEHGIKKQ